MVDHLLRECDLIGKILQSDKNPILSSESDKVDKCLDLLDKFWCFINYFFQNCNTMGT